MNAFLLTPLNHSLIPEVTVDLHLRSIMDKPTISFSHLRVTATGLLTDSTAVIAVIVAQSLPSLTVINADYARCLKRVEWQLA